MEENKISPEFIKAIADKLDRLNKAAGTPVNPHNGHYEDPGMNDPGYMDPLQWMGQAAIDYMNKKKNNNLNEG